MRVEKAINVFEQDNSIPPVNQTQEDRSTSAFENRGQVRRAKCLLSTL
jgi:hypothetical protein